MVIGIESASAWVSDPPSIFLLSLRPSSPSILLFFSIHPYFQCSVIPPSLLFLHPSIFFLCSTPYTSLPLSFHLSSHYSTLRLSLLFSFLPSPLLSTDPTLPPFSHSSRLSLSSFLPFICFPHLHLSLHSPLSSSILSSISSLRRQNISLHIFFPWQYVYLLARVLIYHWICVSEWVTDWVIVSIEYNKLMYHDDDAENDFRGGNGKV